MDLFKDKIINEIIEFEPNSEFIDFIKSSCSKIKMVPQKYGEMELKTLPEISGAFSKWIKLNHPEIEIEIREKDGFLDLRSADYYFPLVLLANQIALPIYLNLVSNYMYEKLKGALRNDSSIIKVEACYEDEKQGKFKKFSYEGPAEKLDGVIKELKFHRF
jgi:hypothetical protein